jgi:hypothetical protein
MAVSPDKVSPSGEASFHTLWHAASSKTALGRPEESPDCEPSGTGAPPPAKAETSSRKVSFERTQIEDGVVGPGHRTNLPRRHLVPELFSALRLGRPNRFSPRRFGFIDAKVRSAYRLPAIPTLWNAFGQGRPP